MDVGLNIKTITQLLWTLSQNTALPLTAWSAPSQQHPLVTRNNWSTRAQLHSPTVPLSSSDCWKWEASSTVGRTLVCHRTRDQRDTHTQTLFRVAIYYCDKKLEDLEETRGCMGRTLKHHAEKHVLINYSAVLNAIYAFKLKSKRCASFCLCFMFNWATCLNCFSWFVFKLRHYPYSTKWLPTLSLLFVHSVKNNDFTFQ